MSLNEINVTQMTWRPRLIKLTLVGNPECWGGKPTSCYVAPELISHILCAAASVIKQGDLSGKVVGLGDCTIIRFYGLPDICVLETTEQVALMRDRELGLMPEMAVKWS